jgi:hypothetical protein
MPVNTVSLIHRDGNGWEHQRMDVTTTRRINVAALVEQAGGPTEFGRRIERDQAQVSQWTSPTSPKPIGGRLARHIEAAMGYERGWLDVSHSEGATQSHSQVVRLDPATVRDVVLILQKLYWEELNRQYVITEEPEVFAELYQRTIERGSTEGSLFWLGTRVRGHGPQGAVSERSTKADDRGHRKRNA